VRRQAGVVYIFNNDLFSWQSPPEWIVPDLALGDPNDDGRNEMVVVVRKTDDQGNLTSHPFVIGYRGGIYRQLWGGSAVAQPLDEVELGDLDGDGFQELVVIEKNPEKSERMITVWRWHGWGFSLVWRSQPGQFQDLSLIRGIDGQLIIKVGVGW